MVDILKILYVDLGGVARYSCDKAAGRVLGWVELQNDVFLLVPKLMEETARKEIRDICGFPEKIKVITLPFSTQKHSSTLGIIYSYFLRVLFAPAVIFQKMPLLDIGYSNSPVLVDIVPILLLKCFGKCRHWVLMMDSIVPPSSKRSGSSFINKITYWESRFVVFLASHFATAVFTVNPVLKREIIRLGMRNDKILLSKNGLFMNRIDKVTASSGGKKYDAAYMGRITENKGIFDLISVWAGIVMKDSSRKLAVMGTGRSDVVELFTDALKENNLEKNVEYFGYVSGDKKYEIFKSSKVFIFLSKVNADESWGISLMEALACGLPALTYDLDIYNHVYADGILQKSKIGDVRAVIEKMTFLLDNEKAWKIASEKGTLFAKQYNWFTISQEDLEQMRLMIKKNYG